MDKYAEELGQDLHGVLQKLNDFSEGDHAEDSLGESEDENDAEERDWIQKMAKQAADALQSVSTSIDSAAKAQPELELEEQIRKDTENLEKNDSNLKLGESRHDTSDVRRALEQEIAVDATKAQGIAHDTAAFIEKEKAELEKYAEKPDDHTSKVKVDPHTRSNHGEQPATHVRDHKKSTAPHSYAKVAHHGQGVDSKTLQNEKHKAEQAGEKAKMLAAKALSAEHDYERLNQQYIEDKDLHHHR